MNYSKLSSYIIVVFSLAFIASTLMMDKANIGSNPSAPKIFPLGLGVLMLICGMFLIFQERKTKLVNDEFKLTITPQAKFIAKIVVASTIYVFLFDKIGYILATILFLSMVLYIFNGKEKLIRSAIIAITFSFGIYLLFAEVLAIRLPGLNIF